MSADEAGQVECFPIRTVAAMTGVSAVTLRAWERRYALLVPARTDSGHRLYSNEDVRLIRRVVQLLERGVPIGRVAALIRDGVPEEQVQALAEASAEAADEGESRAEPSGWAGHQQRMMASIARFDEAKLNELYNEALSLYPLDVVNQRLVMPTLREMGERWRERPAGIAEEHFFSTFLRNKLGARFHHLALAAKGPALVAACVPGERHELGLLLFCLAAAAQAYRVVMLGASMPCEGLAAAVKATGAQGVVLSASVQPGAQTLRELGALVDAVRVPIFLGGAMGPASVRALEGTGIRCVGSAFAGALQHIEEALGGVRGDASMDTG